MFLLELCLGLTGVQVPTHVAVTLCYIIWTIWVTSLPPSNAAGSCGKAIYQGQGLRRTSSSDYEVHVTNV